MSMWREDRQGGVTRWFIFSARAHRISPIRDVHIYGFISSHTVEEAILMKADQLRSLGELSSRKEILTGVHYLKTTLS